MVERSVDNAQVRQKHVLAFQFVNGNQHLSACGHW